MTRRMGRFRVLVSGVLLGVLWLTPIAATGQDLVAVSSITGGSSVFVFRNSNRQAKRFISNAKPARTKTQRMESVKKIRRQFETIAKTAPRREKARVVDPTKIPPRAEATLPAAQVSVLFAGVGEYYLQQGDFAQSFDFFRDAIRLDDKNLNAKTGYSEALAARGNDLLTKDKAKEAKDSFLEALKFDPKNSAAYFGLGEVYAELDETAEAIANYEKALDADKALTEIYVPLGILYFQTDNIAKADELLTKALRASPDSAETQYFLGMVRSSQGRDEEALAAFRKAKTLDPNYADAYFNAAESLVKLKKSAEAIPDYKKAVELKPAYFEAVLGLAEARYETNDFANALADFQTASKLKNDNWQAQAGYGDTLLKTGKFIDAVGKYGLATLFLTRNPGFDKAAAAEIYSKIGFAYGQQCEIDTPLNKPCAWTSAIKALEKAIELTNDPLDYTNLGWAYLNASRADMAARNTADQKAKLGLARAALEKAVASSNPVIADSAAQNLGAVLNDLGDFAGTVRTLAPVYGRHPEWTFSGYALGTAYFLTNDFANAAKILRSVADRGPGPFYMPALTNLGATEIKRKNKKELLKIVEEMRKVSPQAALILEQQMKLAKI
ncbi:MAG TPA: tetratricopeptide repeat protein [Pyrinomonadaceae bacterium]|nr:tetratricopeptide repeat protein [Pyrinomonadaceae bacterium]